MWSLWRGCIRFSIACDVVTAKAATLHVELFARVQVVCPGLVAVAGAYLEIHIRGRLILSNGRLLGLLERARLPQVA
jgi:hypothetical protein